MCVCMCVHLHAMKNQLKPELSNNSYCFLVSSATYMALAINVTDRYDLSNKSCFVKGHQGNGVFAIQFTIKTV